MQSIPVPPSNSQAEHVHGISWSHIFRIRDGVAFMWYRRFRMLIPLEEFLSVGNLVIAQAMRIYEPGRPPPFSIYLAKALHHRMATVPREEWSGWVTYERSEERDGTGRRKLLRRAVHAPAIEPLPAIEIDDESDGWPTLTPQALQTCVPYETRVYIQEGLKYLRANADARRRAIIHYTSQDEGPQEIAARYRTSYQNIQKTLQRTQQRVQRWSQETSHAAAD